MFFYSALVLVIISNASSHTRVMQSPTDNSSSTYNDNHSQQAVVSAGYDTLQHLDQGDNSYWLFPLSHVQLEDSGLDLGLQPQDVPFESQDVRLGMYHDPVINWSDPISSDAVWQGDFQPYPTDTLLGHYPTYECPGNEGFQGNAYQPREIPANMIDPSLCLSTVTPFNASDQVVTNMGLFNNGSPYTDTCNIDQYVGIGTHFRVPEEPSIHPALARGSVAEAANGLARQDWFNDASVPLQEAIDANHLPAKTSQIGSEQWAILRPTCFKNVSPHTLISGETVEDDTGTLIEVVDVKYTKSGRLLTVLGKSEDKLTRYMFCTSTSCEKMIDLELYRGDGWPMSISVHGFGHDSGCRQAAAISDKYTHVDSIHGACRGCPTRHLVLHHRIQVNETCADVNKRVTSLRKMQGIVAKTKFYSWMTVNKSDPRMGKFSCCAPGCQIIKQGSFWHKGKPTAASQRQYFAHSIQCCSSIWAANPTTNLNTIARWCWSTVRGAQGRGHMVNGNDMRSGDVCGNCSRRNRESWMDE